MRCPKYTVLGISGSWGNVGFTPLLRSPAQTVRAASPPAHLGPLQSGLYPRLHTQLPLHPQTTAPAAQNPGPPRSEPSPRSEARIPALAFRPQRDSHPEPQLCPPVRRGPLCLESLSSKTPSCPSRPVQVSPPSGSPLRSRHGTLQLPPHSAQHLWALSSYLAFWSFPRLPQVPLLLPLGPLTLCWVSRLLFSLLVPLSLSSRPLLMLVPGAMVSSPLTSWHIHSHPQGPAPKSATRPISSHLPSRHQQALGALVPLKCTQLCLFSALGLICLPRGGTCPVPHLWVQQDAERGRPGLGLGGQTWTLPCGIARAGR